MDTPVQVELQKLTFLSSVLTLEAIYRFYQVQWPVRMDGEREPKESVLLAHLDETYDYIRILENKDKFRNCRFIHDI